MRIEAPSLATDAALLALRDFIQQRDRGTAERGLAYAEGNTITDVWLDGHSLCADIVGTDDYITTLSYEEGTWTGACSCPVETNCKHCVALAFDWLRECAEAKALQEAAALKPEAKPKPKPKPQAEKVARQPEAPALQAAAAKAPLDQEEENRKKKELAAWSAGLERPPEQRKEALPWVSLKIRILKGRWQLLSQIKVGGRFDVLRRSHATPLWMDLHSYDLSSLSAAQLSLHLHLQGYSLGVSSTSVKGQIIQELFRLGLNEDLLCGPNMEPLKLEPEPLYHVALPAEKGRVRFKLCVGEAQEEQAALLLTTEPFPLYTKGGRFWKGPHPLPAEEAPVELFEDAHNLRRLHQSGIRLDPKLQKPIRSVQLEPWFKLSIGKEWFDEKEFISIECYGVVPGSSQKLQFTPKGWFWEKKEPVDAMDSTGALVVYERTLLDEAANRLPELGLRPYDEDAWTCWLTKDFPERLHQWCRSLPSHTRVLAEKELAGLIEDPWKARVEVRAEPVEGSGTDWFDLHLGFKVEDLTLSQEELRLLLKARGGWVRLAKHGFRRLETEVPGEQLTHTLGTLGLSTESLLDAKTGSSHRLHALQLGEGLELLDDAKLRANVQKRLQSTSSAPEPLPAGLLATLRPYQEQGYQFLVYLSRNGFGGILADDMGLGKTVQTIAWLLHLGSSEQAAGRPFRVLIVCPKSVTHGWLSEVARFAPTLNPRDMQTVRLSRPPEGLELLVYNYAQLRLSASELQGITWTAVVLDEGQFIKNPGSQVAQCARALKTRHRLVLTGTPIENRMLDLWSLFAFAQPGLLGSQASFQAEYGKGETGALERLRLRTRHFMARRTKAQVATDLPARIEDEIVVDLEDEQRTLYEAELKKARQQLLAIRTSADFDKSRFNLLTSLLRLRQICCHPGLLDSSAKKEGSAKLEALVERLTELKEEGHKVLIFSQFVGMLELLEQRLKAEGFHSLLLTGQTENRADLVQRFQEDDMIDCFLLSIRAAGFGLNLTKADYVFLFDPWWNPALENQAIDRAHRIGQQQVVTAYRLIAANTIEEKIRLMQKDKAALAGQIVQEESLANVMDLESLRRILL